VHGHVSLECVTCGQSFGRRENLQRHIFSCHKTRRQRKSKQQSNRHYMGNASRTSAPQSTSPNPQQIKEEPNEEKAFEDFKKEKEDELRIKFMAKREQAKKKHEKAIRLSN
jgi:hypothetical protein